VKSHREGGLLLGGPSSPSALHTAEGHLMSRMLQILAVAVEHHQD
jgi:hypothetical protein